MLTPARGAVCLSCHACTLSAAQSVLRPAAEPCGAPAAGPGFGACCRLQHSGAPKRRCRCISALRAALPAATGSFQRAPTPVAAPAEGQPPGGPAHPAGRELHHAGGPRAARAGQRLQVCGEGELQQAGQRGQGSRRCSGAGAAGGAGGQGSRRCSGAGPAGGAGGQGRGGGVTIRGGPGWAARGRAGAAPPRAGITVVAVPPACSFRRCGTCSSRVPRGPLCSTTRTR